MAKKNHKKHYPYTRLVRSCITGKVVWIYRGASKAGCHQAYWRACKKELERVKNWPKTIAERKDGILRFLNNCMANLPIDAKLTPAQKSAVRQVQALADANLHTDFYDHIMESRRRRAEIREIRRMEREREKNEKS